jgi:hypothetical protein
MPQPAVRAKLAEKTVLRASRSVNDGTFAPVVHRQFWYFCKSKAHLLAIKQVNMHAAAAAAQAEEERSDRDASQRHYLYVCTSKASKQSPFCTSKASKFSTGERDARLLPHAPVTHACVGCYRQQNRQRTLYIAQTKKNVAIFF